MNLMIATILQEKERIDRMMEKYQEELEKLPKGTISEKKAGQSTYFYLKYRDGKKVISRYIPRKDVEDIRRQVEKRRHMAFDKKDTFALGNTMKDLDFSGSAGRIRCPTLILCGEKDSANIKSAHFMARQLPGAELQILRNTGHVANEENPKGLAEHLNRFYARWE